MAESCSACRFWLLADEIDEYMQKDGNDAHGWCRRYPPQIVDRMAQMAIPPLGNASHNYDPEDVATVHNVHKASLHPAAFGDEWCGEFKRREAAHG